MVECAKCGARSAGRYFCPRCSALLPAPVGPVPARLALADGRSVDCSAWQGRWPADCWRPLHTTCGGAPCRAYAINPDWWRELAGAVRERAACSLGVLAPVAIAEVGEGAVVVAEALPGAGRPLAAPPAGEGEVGQLEATLAACERLGSVMGQLHGAGLVWLTFDPAALECGGGREQAANLDLMLYAAGGCPDGLPLLAAYESPEAGAFRGEQVGPATDVYHLGLYAYYALAGLLPEGLPGLGLAAFDFALPPLRVYRPQLAPGVSAVLGRATARAPEDRFGSVAAFLGALSRAVAEAREDATAAPRRLCYTHGGATAVGRCHEVQGLGNQDAQAVLPVGDGLVAVVADGVTYVKVGTGEIASRLAVGSLTASLPAALAGARSRGQEEEALARCCLGASEVILTEALRLAGGRAVEPTDLMCTTVVVGLVRGDELVLASAGDSHAFLVRGGEAEQLTVDGDLRCELLASGTPPEEVAALGAEGGALYHCLGVGVADESGRLGVCPERGTPRLGRFRLRAGDVVVLATDGLVEEGVFLGAAELAPLVERYGGGSAAELAGALVAEARARHRGPSEEEPEGVGDDVTCVVVRAEAWSKP